jgi:hypothetical protein
MIRGDSIRQTASITRCISVALTADDHITFDPPAQASDQAIGVASRRATSRIHDLRKTAQIGIPQAPFAGGICFFLNICAKCRSGVPSGLTPASVFPQTVQPLRE